MSERLQLRKARRLVIKIGSALLTDDGKGLDVAALGLWVDQIAELIAEGVEVVVVSSGSVAEGMSRLGWSSRPQHLHELQAAAAVGQMGLVQTWEAQFKRHDIHTAQILLTHDDLSDRKRYLNGRSTLRTLLDYGVVPIVNENDTVVTDEIRFGDNDTLGALVANLIEADGLIILTDQLGLFNKDPRKHQDAELVTERKAEDRDLDAMAGGGAGALGRGGMLTKLRAARLAARSGAFTVIVGGRIEHAISRLRQGDVIGTLLLPEQGRMAARKQWIASHLQTRGKLTLDDGAVKVLRQGGRSLLPVGVKAIAGQFRRGEMVSCVDLNGREIARGLVNYDADEARAIAGRSSDRIADVLGYVSDEEMIHRDNLVVV
ncbi:MULTISPECIES: glutamate 5-kinase [Marinobacter]|jgi:glutamate 5-kinase|uniref:Glutamate 5-kinase n=3 Tax=Marinobacter TaxID=2742 RepID=A0A455W8C3_MARNT|nr:MULTISPECIES: glutamate 5-kinase [unclassified Marinobacter]MAO12695.1 glutamate 5-kinase [Marinobacter sp.]QFS85883.1 Glutamate 5-kinase [Marinobacter sp. THAF197a]QFT49677.1 Glutamate 5-kinase [Marinobacter sp. THAF39]BBJ02885.1 glutamate 5-kinase [Marinobacter nauticus]